MNDTTEVALLDRVRMLIEALCNELESVFR